MPHGAERDVEERRSGPEDTVAVEVPKENVDKNTTPGTTILLFRSKKERLQKITTYLKLTQVAKNQFGFATAILWH
jgi:hypothetical protein